MKNREEIERMYVQCGHLSKQQKSLERSPLEKLESAVAAWLKQARESNACINITQLKKKIFCIFTSLEIANFSDSNGYIDRFKRRHNIVYRTLSDESRSVHPVTAEDWKIYGLLKETEVYDLHYIYTMLMRPVYFSVYRLANLHLLRNVLPWWYET
jgi:hypothetical protein